MSDLDKRLKESLTAVRDAYAEDRHADRFESRARFIERYRRRRRMFTAGSIALAGAALIAGLVFTGEGLDLFAVPDPDSEVAGELPDGVVSSVPTGAEPIDAGIRLGGVWVANSADSTLSHVDPTINRVVATIPLAGPPQEVDVGEGAVWVAGFGSVTAIDSSTDEVIDSVAIEGAEDRISISVGEGAVWAVVDESRLVKVDPDELTYEDIEGPTRPIDVAAREGSVWVLDAEQGLLQLDPATGQAVGEPIGGVTSGDVSAGRSAIWLADEDEDTIIRLDATTRAFGDTYQVDGTYIDMAVSETVLWVLSEEGGRSLLTALDTGSAEPLGSPLELTGDPVEVSSGAGGVWVVARESGAILRIDPAAVTL